MVYMGSKNRYCKYIIPIIQKYIDENDISLFIDCFTGSASVIDKINCRTLIANDLSPTLISLHKQAQKNFDLIPQKGSREYWDKAYTEWKNIKKALDNKEEYKSSMPLYEIGAIEWYGSFNNGGFPRGYAKPSATRDFYKEAYKNHKKQAQKENYKKIEFIRRDYKKLLQLAFDYQSLDFGHPKMKICFYCDAPYRGTKPYAINSNFNFEEYYDWLREVSESFPIFISEQNMPEDFPIVWSKDVIRTNNTTNDFKACEKLYLLKNK